MLAVSHQLGVQASCLVGHVEPFGGFQHECAVGYSGEVSFPPGGVYVWSVWPCKRAAERGVWLPRLFYLVCEVFTEGRGVSEQQEVYVGDIHVVEAFKVFLRYKVPQSVTHGYSVGIFFEYVFDNGIVVALDHFKGVFNDVVQVSTNEYFDVIFRVCSLCGIYEHWQIIAVMVVGAYGCYTEFHTIRLLYICRR